MRHHQCQRHGATQVSDSYQGATFCVLCLEGRPITPAVKPDIDETWGKAESVLRIAQIACIGAIPAAAFLLNKGAGLKGASLMVPLTGITAIVFTLLLVLWWRSKERS